QPLPPVSGHTSPADGVWQRGPPFVRAALRAAASPPTRGARPHLLGSSPQRHCPIRPHGVVPRRAGVPPTPALPPSGRASSVHSVERLDSPAQRCAHSGAPSP